MNQRLIQEGTALPLTIPLKVDFNHKCHLVLESTQGDFGKELVVLLIIPFNFFVSLWCLWRFKQKLSILDHWGSHSIWHAKRCSSFKFNNYLRECTTTVKKLLLLYAKQSIENSRGRTLDQKLIRCLQLSMPSL